MSASTVTLTKSSGKHRAEDDVITSHQAPAIVDRFCIFYDWPQYMALLAIARRRVAEHGDFPAHSPESLELSWSAAFTHSPDEL